jgi:hypothetical protein
MDGKPTNQDLSLHPRLLVAVLPPVVSACVPAYLWLSALHQKQDPPHQKSGGLPMKAYYSAATRGGV